MTYQRREVLAEGVTLYLGDCRDVLPTLGKVDCVLMDPPYGLGASDTEKNNYLSFSDDAHEVEGLVKFILDNCPFDRLVMTPGQKMMFKYPEPTATGAFYYPAGVGSCSWGFVCWQPIFYYGKDPALQDGRGRAANSYYSTEQAEKNGHPCPKPIGQWNWLLNRVSRKDETILDPFMGSGTTGVSAVKFSRKFIGIEINETYFDIACRRIEDALRRPDLFIPAPAPKAKQESLL